MRTPLALAVLGVLALGGCTEDHSTIWIDRLAAPTAEEAGCVASGDALVGGSVRVGAPYSAFLVLSNAVRNNARDLSNDTAPVLVEGIEISLSDAEGNPIGGSYTQPVGGFIPSANGAGDVGQATVAATIIPANISGGLAPGSVVIVSMQVFGHTLGGHDVESGFFAWPLTVDAASACTVCSEDATAIDICTPQQDGGCQVVECAP